MILAIDVGNTRVKAMLAGPGRVVPLFALDTEAVLRDPGEIRRRLDEGRPAVPRVEGAAMCSVVPALDRPLASALGRAAGKSVVTVRHTCRFPFRLRVADPSKLGADRLCAAAGAVGARRTEAVIVDIGSALTVDLVHAGAFMGGLIMPGPGLGLRALGRYARRLPRIDESALARAVPERFDDTRPSMILGAIMASRGAVVESVRFMRRRGGVRPGVFVTGGGAGILSPHLPKSWTRDPHLVGKGLYRLWVLHGAPQKKS